MFQDEARFGRLSRCRYCWAKFPLRPTVKAMLVHQYVYVYGAVSIPQGNFDSLVLPHVNGGCMGLYLAEISRQYPNDNILMVLEGAGWHKNKSMPIPENIRLLSLPSYSPELNPAEHLWDELREKHFHNRAFDSLDALLSLENNPVLVQSICNFDCIINVTYIANYNKLRESHDAKLVGATEGSYPVIAAVTIHNAMEGLPRKEVHDLREQRLAIVHRCEPSRKARRLVKAGNRRSNRGHPLSPRNARQYWLSSRYPSS